MNDRVDIAPLCGFRAANQAGDFEYAYGLARRTIEPYVVALAGEWPDEFQRSFFEKGFSDPAMRMIVYEGRTIGCCCIDETAEAVKLQRTYLEPEFQKHGIGRFIMALGLQKAHEVRKPLELEVLQSNLSAVDAYGKSGFDIFGKTAYSWVREYRMRHRDTNCYVPAIVPLPQPVLT